MDVDTLVPFGLIINELITNSLKYAFPDGRVGKLLVHLEEQKDQLILRIEDNGIGYNPTTIRENSFGSTLISALVDQLDGELNVTNTNGTKIAIAINKTHPK